MTRCPEQCCSYMWYKKDSTVTHVYNITPNLHHDLRKMDKVYNWIIMTCKRFTMDMNDMNPGIKPYT